MTKPDTQTTPARPRCYGSKEVLNKLSRAENQCRDCPHEYECADLQLKTTPEKWFAVCETGTCYDEGQERDAARTWTVSRSHQEVGWNTDGGYEGYGLTREDAQFLADAANDKLAKEGRLR